MLQTRLNRPRLSSDLLQRPHLVERLKRSSHLPLILVSAPAGYGKSVLISQWLEQENDYAWLSLDESMNDPSTFLSYFTYTLSEVGGAELNGFKNWERENYLLSWEAVIDRIVNELNGLTKPIRLIMDDYHLIRNQEIQTLMDAIINEDIKMFRLVIITRRDPPFRLRGLRLYHKMLDLRAQDLKFDQNNIRDFLRKERIESFSDDQLNELILRTEGWILAIRIILVAGSFPSPQAHEEKSFTLSTNLDSLMGHISDKLDPVFFKQLQLSSLCDQYSEELLESIFSHVFKESGSASVFLTKLKELNFFIVPTSDDGTWYRFHHLIGDILKKQLERNEPTIINPLYIKISEWFLNKNLVEEAIHYAIKAKNYEFACEQITKHRASILDQGHWWIVQRWLDKIPRHIRKSNVDMLLTELLVCEETWGLEDFSSILETLKSVGIENSTDENVAQYLYHLGYFLTYVKPDPKKAVESLERSKALYHDESYMFGGRRELILASSTQMIGLTTLALQSLEEIEEKFNPSSKMHLRAIHGKVLVHLLSGNFESAYNDSRKMLFFLQDSDLRMAKGWVLYFQGNVAFQFYDDYEAIQALKEALAFEGLFNYRAYFDALAGLVLINSLKNDEKATASFLEQMSELAAKLKDIKFQNYYHSVQARVNWHNGLGEKELSWAKTDRVKQYPSSYLFLIDVPELTKLRILISHGSYTRVEEAISVLKEVETMLESVHNQYQRIDVVLLKAMAFWRLGKKKRAAKCLEEALMLADKKGLIRPVMEAYRVMPELFNEISRNDEYNRILSRFGIDSPPQKSAYVPAMNDTMLTAREQEVVELIAKGLHNKEVADQLNISTVTVKSHLTNIYKKLGVSNRTSMIRILQEH
ncbi:LuxR C-terminal-related transcriptional regulator [Fulvivirga sedimenti]|uniref:LuxR C-terminal-related transcriptional regulator n=1 Tax=Fulvivirga sedimenti TaxID=2879465 RepID=A0A9X1HW51_9BACT|nr:LuxR C-terminal-related transcriptional regulator [Fulvivirga sedimenti]MCA6078951.1 LuxR C-terminal-related transcriptional regulator [Fulvivirga sedimenti]